MYTDLRYMFNLSISKSDPDFVVISEGTTTVFPIYLGRNAFTLNASTEDRDCVGIRNPIPDSNSFPSAVVLRNFISSSSDLDACLPSLLLNQ